MSISWFLRLALALLAFAVAPLASEAAPSETADCEGYDPLSGSPALSVAHVGGTDRTHFIQNGSDAPSCPDASDACRAKAFLVPGDRVIVGAPHGGFVCADYIGAKGADRAGWLPAAAVTREDATPVGLQDWSGTWLRQEAQITLTVAKAGALAIHGEATWGADDPDRVKRGAFNLGNIDGVMAPSGADLSFAMGDKATLPVGKAEEDACQVWMRRLGAYLLVDDNRNCGGMNVSFRGVYQRKP